MVAMRQYQVVGRKAPTEKEPNPPVYRMKVFAPNEVTGASQFWYLMHQMRKMKKTTGEILDIIEVSCVFNFGSKEGGKHYFLSSNPQMEV